MSQPVCLPDYVHDAVSYVDPTIPGTSPSVRLDPRGRIFSLRLQGLAETSVDPGKSRVITERVR